MYSAQMGGFDERLQIKKFYDENIVKISTGGRMARVQKEKKEKIWHTNCYFKKRKKKQSTQSE